MYYQLHVYVRIIFNGVLKKMSGRVKIHFVWLQIGINVWLLRALGKTACFYTSLVSSLSFT
jgi:hypothetical protein